MSADTYIIGLIRSGPDSAVRGSALRKCVAKVVHGLVMYAQGFSAGRNAAYLAERYYAMNDAQLARIGLTRDRIPDALRRLF